MSKIVKYTQNSLKLAIDKTWKWIEESPEIGFFKNKKEMDDEYNSFLLLWDKKNIHPNEISKYA